jgi:hypothetical protein
MTLKVPFLLWIEAEILYRLDSAERFTDSRRREIVAPKASIHAAETA